MAKPAILVHGGAGRIHEDDRAEAAAEGCLLAARAGHAILAAGGSALDAVEAAAIVLEDDPLFNAGIGSSLNVDGIVEHDAMIMEGAGLRAGGICALPGFQNPIRIARRVMERSPHVLLAADGAALFARAEGIEPVPPSTLVTERALERWRREKKAGWPRRPGTIGAVAIDTGGHVAAATSTGGISGKLAGRVGDTPLPGCGTYADDLGGAASATGYGEEIMRVVMAKHAVDRMAEGMAADEAAASAVEALERVSGEGGIVVVDRSGRVGFAFNTERMSRAFVDGDGREEKGFER